MQLMTLVKLGILSKVFSLKRQLVIMCPEKICFLLHLINIFQKKLCEFILAIITVQPLSTFIWRLENSPLEKRIVQQFLYNSLVFYYKSFQSLFDIIVLFLVVGVNIIKTILLISMCANILCNLLLFIFYVYECLY